MSATHPALGGGERNAALYLPFAYHSGERRVERSAARRIARSLAAQLRFPGGGLFHVSLCACVFHAWTVAVLLSYRATPLC